MTLLLELLSSGWISALAVAVLWIETAVLSMLSREPMKRLRALFANACSGTCLLIAVAVALRGDNPLWIMALMAGSLIAHGFDIVLRTPAQADGLSRKTE